MKTSLNEKGFSLIELMVVVGIIGILAAIAVPNYQKFQAKSRQTEAKSNLGGLYTAEKAFYAEWNLFFSDFFHIGFSPEGNLRYRVGFGAAGTAIPANSGYTGPGCTDPTKACSSANYVTNIYCPKTTTMASTCTEMANFVKALPTTSLTDQAFTAGASSNIDADATFDQWTIDNKKNLSNVTPDLAD